MAISIKRWLRRQIRIGFDKFPDFMQAPIYRKMLCLSDQLPKELTIKIAETRDELEQAFELVYSSYKEIGIIGKSKEQIWITKYQLLPSSAVIIAKWNEEVVGTACIIIDSSLGLPIEQASDISSYRDKGLTLGEVSSLAIRRNFRGKNSRVAMPLLKYIYEYSYNYAGLDVLFATIHKSARGYFKNILLFDDLPRKESCKYTQVNDSSPATLLVNLNTVVDVYYSKYNKEPNEKNLYRYYKELKFSNFEFGSSPIEGTVCPVLKPEDLNYFLSKKMSMPDRVHEDEIKVIGASYYFKEFKEVLSAHTQMPITEVTRNNLRVLFNRKLTVMEHSHNTYISCKLRDISRSGVRLRCEKEIPKGTILTIHIPATDFYKSVQTEFQVLWGKNNLFGCKIVHLNEGSWANFIDLLEGQFLKLAK